MTEDEIRAEAVREAAAYLERIYKRGLQSRDSLLADLDSVAFRMEQGMTARGNMRRHEPTDPSPAQCTHEGGEWPGIDRCADCGQLLEPSEQEHGV